MKWLLLVVLLVSGCGRGLSYEAQDRLDAERMQAKQVSTAGSEVQVLTNRQKFYDPSVWRFRVDGGWIYITVTAGNSTTVFVLDSPISVKGNP